MKLSREFCRWREDIAPDSTLIDKVVAASNGAEHILHHPIFLDALEDEGAGKDKDDVMWELAEIKSIMFNAFMEQDDELLAIRDRAAELEKELAVCERALLNLIDTHYPSNADLIEYNQKNDARIELAREEADRETSADTTQAETTEE